MNLETTLLQPENSPFIPPACALPSSSSGLTLQSWVQRAHLPSLERVILSNTDAWWGEKPVFNNYCLVALSVWLFTWKPLASLLPPNEIPRKASIPKWGVGEGRVTRAGLVVLLALQCARKIQECETTPCPGGSQQDEGTGSKRWQLLSPPLGGVNLKPLRNGQKPRKPLVILTKLGWVVLVFISGPQPWLLTHGSEEQCVRLRLKLREKHIFNPNIRQPMMFARGNFMGKLPCLCLGFSIPKTGLMPFASYLIGYLWMKE